MAFNYKLIEVVKEAANTVFAMNKSAKDFNIPTKQQLDNKPVTPNQTVLVKPPISRSSAQPLKDINNLTDREKGYGVTFSPSPANRGIHELDYPYAYQDDLAKRRAFVPEGLQGKKVIGPDHPYHDFVEDWLNANYSVVGLGYNRQNAHRAINSNIENKKVYEDSIKRLADTAFSNRMSVPYRKYPPVFGYSSHAHMGGADGYVLHGDRTPGVHLNPNFDRLALLLGAGQLAHDPNITAIHEIEHAGTQHGRTPWAESTFKPYDKRKATPQEVERAEEIDRNQQLFASETPAVLAELANSAQAAYESRNNKPLKGTFNLVPSGAQPLNIKLEDLRRGAYIRGHTGGPGNVSMTELLNSPEGKEFLRMNLRRMEFAKKIQDKKIKEYDFSPSGWGIN